MNKENYIDFNKLFDEQQKKFLSDRSDRNINKLYEIVYKCALKRIITYGNKRNINILDKTDKAHDITTEIIMRYYSDKDFYIRKLSTYIYFPLTKILTQNKLYEQKEILDCDMNYDEVENLDE